ncbi:MAG: hypothetical protein WA060_03370 [Minisyncoccia bacterium]
MEEKFKFPNPREHLKEGVKPIVVCIGTPEDFSKQDLESAVSFGVDWKNGVYQSGQKGEFFTAGPTTYVISAIDDKDKFTEGLNRCTSLIVSGLDKETKKNISFLTHQPPGMISFMKEYVFADEAKKEQVRRIYPFLDDLKTQLLKMKEKCESGTTDAVIVGGSLGKLTPVELTEQRKKMNDYLLSVEILKENVKQVLGFNPREVNGPKRDGGQDSLRFDNEHRRLYFIRSEINQNI